MNSIKVLVIDNSALVRQSIRKILAANTDICVVSVEADFAAASIARHDPDVIIADLLGLSKESLRLASKIAAERNISFIAFSHSKDTENPGAARVPGVVAHINKPEIGIADFLQNNGARFVNAVRAAARTRPATGAAVAGKDGATAGTMLAGKATPPPASAQRPGVAASPANHRLIIAIGASTGGAQALDTLLTALPEAMPCILVVQHMPKFFTAMFAERLNSISALQVREAMDGDPVLPGQVLVAPGDRHMRLNKTHNAYHVSLGDDPPINRHKPSVDELFYSVAQVAGADALGVILTGMGDDGARGMREMRQAGAKTIAEDESTCVVFGMPKAAIDRGGVQWVTPLQQIPGQLIALSR